MSLWHCTACSASYAVGLERCPQCGDSQHLEDPLPPLAWTCQDPACRAQWKLRLLHCPRCHGKQMRLEEIMARITVGGGPSNAAAQPGEPGYMPPPETETADAPAQTEDAAPSEAGPQAPDETPGRPPVNASKATWIDHVVGQGLDKETAETMTKPQLQAWQPPAVEDGPKQELTLTAEAEVTRTEPEAGP